MCSEAAGAGLFRISLARWANGLRCLDEDGVTVGELQSRPGAACNVGGIERWGWLTVGDGGAERRAGYGTARGVTAGPPLRPTRAGSYARRTWPAAVAQFERRWRTRFGAERVDALRVALDAYAGPWPWSPPEVHASDGFRTHVVAGPPDGGPDDAPPGQRPPVRRRGRGRRRAA